MFHFLCANGSCTTGETVDHIHREIARLKKHLNK